MTKKIKKLSIRSLARKTGADRESISKWIAGITDEKEALRIIHERQRRAVRVGRDTGGLTWWQRLQKERARELERENNRMEAQYNQDYMLTADHHKILEIGRRLFANLGAKAKETLGLTDGQATAVQRAISEALDVAEGIK